MSLPAIRVVDVQHDNKVMELEDLTETALGSLIWECEQLLDELKDAHRAEANRVEDEVEYLDPRYRDDNVDESGD